MIELKQIASFKYNYSSSQTKALHPLLQPSNSLNSSTAITVSFTLTFGKFFLCKEAKLTRNPFLLLYIDRKEEKTG